MPKKGCSKTELIDVLTKPKENIDFCCLTPVGFMEELDNRWILVDSKSQCPEGNSAPATLGLTNMAGKLCDLLVLSQCT